MLPTTWFYLSSLMILVVFFRFNRIWSIRNIDLLGLIALAPGLLFLAMGEEYTGYSWLYAIGILLFIRLWIDPFLVRRPLLEPNLALSGLIFGLVTLLLFLIPNLIINRGEIIDSNRTLRLEQILSIRDYSKYKETPRPITPGYIPFQKLAQRVDQVFIPPENIQEEILGIQSGKGEKTSTIRPIKNSAVWIPQARAVVFHTSSDFSDDFDDSLADEFSSYSEGIDPSESLLLTSNEPIPLSETIEKNLDRPDVESLNRQIDEAKEHQEEVHSEFAKDAGFILLVVAIQVGIIIGLIIIGHCHFGNFRCGIAAAMVYLLLPYVNQMTGSIDHFLPGMLLVFAVMFYRRPVFSGLMIGLAGSLTFYAFFLLPLWFSFYWKRGSHRFTIGVVSAVLIMGLLLLFSPAGYGTYEQQISAMFGLHSMRIVQPTGLWAYIPVYYRIPVITFFLVITFGMLIWPSSKNLGTLIACSTMVMLGAQSWMGYEGGLYMGWYLPLLIMTVFRPNLEDKMAATSVIEV